jgi:hypothetical protein
LYLILTSRHFSNSSSFNFSQIHFSRLTTPRFASLCFSFRRFSCSLFTSLVSHSHSRHFSNSSFFNFSQLHFSHLTSPHLASLFFASLFFASLFFFSILFYSSLFTSLVSHPHSRHFSNPYSFDFSRLQPHLVLFYSILLSSPHLFSLHFICISYSLLVTSQTHPLLTSPNFTSLASPHLALLLFSFFFASLFFFILFSSLHLTCILSSPSQILSSLNLS